MKSHELAKSRPASLHSQLSEREVIDILTDHASKVASEVLENMETGKDLKEDARVRKIEKKSLTLLVTILDQTIT